MCSYVAILPFFCRVKIKAFKFALDTVSYLNVSSMLPMAMEACVFSRTDPRSRYKGMSVDASGMMTWAAGREGRQHAW